MKSIIYLIIIIIIFPVTNAKADSGELWGMTKFGGAHNKGVIFRADKNGSGHKVLFSFEGEGFSEGKMAEYQDGEFYGTTTGGGKYGYGVIYRFEASTGKFSRIMDFDGENTGGDGAGGLVLASNGKFYGMTVRGGIYDRGTLFEFEPGTKTFIKKADLDSLEKGSEPLGSLIEGTDGKLYGMTSMGGVYDAGIIFSFDIHTGVFMKLFDFDGGEMGSNPMGSLTEASDKRLYGMTRWGGQSNFGVIFRFDPEARQFNILFHFNDVGSGRFPHGSLTEVPDGMLYGTTSFGGNYNQGVLFGYNLLTNTFIKKYDFTEDQEIRTYGTLVLAPNKNLYGIVHNSYGSDFVLMEFDYLQDSIREVSYEIPGLRDYYGNMESLVLAANGKMYFQGMDNFYIEKESFLFEFDPGSRSITRHFNNSSSSTGSYPYGSLTEAGNGKLYALAGRGGEYDYGVLFEFDPVTLNYQKITDFDGIKNGSYPKSSLLVANNSKLYGMTSEGGAEGKGVLFEFDPVTKDFCKIFDFGGEGKGANPHGSLIQAADGKLYGMTALGGESNQGILFSFDFSTLIFEKLLDFDGAEKGSQPNGSLIQVTSGLLYGTTKNGGTFDKGVLFGYDTGSGIYLKLSDCENLPVEIMQASNGRIYGSGLYVFEYNPADNSYSEIETIPSIGPIGKLTEITKDTLMGMDFGEIAYQAGIENRGGIFILSLVNCNASMILEFNGANGRHPDNSSLLLRGGNDNPAAVCKDISLYLDENGQAGLHPLDIAVGSELDGFKLTLSKSKFLCEDIGENVVMLTVTDGEKKPETCNALVMLEDTIVPDITCIGNGKVYLEPYEKYSRITDSLLMPEATDNCGIESVSYMVKGNEPVTLSLDENLALEAGTFEVKWQFTDGSGNSSSCTSVLSVLKRPTALLIPLNKIQVDSVKICFKAILTDELTTTGIEGKELVFLFKDSVKTVVTNENGVAEATFSNAGYASGDQSVAVSFYEEATYTGSETETEFITGTSQLLIPGTRAYPNPFTDKIYIEFFAPESAEAMINVVDITGKLVEVIFSEPVESGRYYKAEFMPRSGSNGFYIYSIRIGKFRHDGKIIYFP